MADFWNGYKQNTTKEQPSASSGGGFWGGYKAPEVVNPETEAPVMESSYTQTTINLDTPKMGPENKSAFQRFTYNFTHPKNFTERTMEAEKELDPYKQKVLDATVNTPLGRKIVGETEKQTRGSRLFIAPMVATGKFWGDVFTGKKPVNFASDVEQFATEWEAASKDEQNSMAENVVRQTIDSGPQSLVGVVLNLVPFVGPALSTGYFSTLSMAEQQQNGGDVTSLKKVAIDTAGDKILGGVIENILKKPAVELTKAGFAGFARNALTGAGVEGTTEPLQTFSKYAVDYGEATTPEQRANIVQEVKNYVKNGGLITEFLVGGIAGGLISGAASGISGRIDPSYIPIKREDDKDFNEKQNAYREEFRNDVITNLQEPDASYVEVANDISRETGMPNEVATALVEAVAEDNNIPLVNLSTSTEVFTQSVGNPESLDFTDMGTATGDVDSRTAMIPLMNAQKVLKNAGYSDAAIDDILTSLADKVKSSVGKQSIKASDIKEAAFEYSTSNENPDIITSVDKIKTGQEVISEKLSEVEQLIKDKLTEGYSKLEVIQQLQKKYNLNIDDAVAKMESYSKTAEKAIEGEKFQTTADIKTEAKKYKSAEEFVKAKGGVLNIPVKSISTSEPSDAVRTVTEVGRKITEPIDVVWNQHPNSVKENGEFVVLDGHHRLQQATINGDKTITANVDVDTTYIDDNGNEHSLSDKEISDIWNKANKPTSKKKTVKFDTSAHSEETIKIADELDILTKMVDIPMSKGEAVIIDPDMVKKIAGDQSTESAHKFSRVSEYVYDYALSVVKNPVVLFTSGGPGSGKSEIVVEEIKSGFDGIIFDAPHAREYVIDRRVEKAAKAGKSSIIHTLIVDPLKAREYVLMREIIEGRGVPVEYHADTHIGVIETALINISKGYEVLIRDIRGINSIEEARKVKWTAGPVETLALLEKISYNKDTLINELNNVKLTDQQNKSANDRLSKKVKAERRSAKGTSKKTKPTIKSGIQSDGIILKSNQEVIESYQEQVSSDIKDSGFITTEQALEQAMKIPIFAQLHARGQVALAEQLNNPKALASYYDGMIKFLNNPHQTTLPHESFHAFLDMVLTQDEKAQALDLVREEGMSDIQIEEALTQQYAEWYVNQSKKSALQKFFEKITNFFKGLVGARDEIQSLFYRTLNKKSVAKITRFENMGGMEAVRNEYNQNPAEFTSQLMEDDNLWKKDRVKRATIIGSLGRLKKPIMKEFVSNKLDTEFKGQDVIDMAQFKRSVMSDLLDMKIIDSNTYADYGLSNIGQRDVSAHTYIINTNFLHGKTGHFGGQFDVRTTKDDLEIRKVTAGNHQVEGQTQEVKEDQYYVVRKDISKENLEEAVFEKFNTETDAQAYINGFSDRVTSEPGLFGHFRAFKDDTYTFSVVEMQSDVFQHDLDSMARDNKRRYQVEKAKIEREIKNNEQDLANLKDMESRAFDSYEDPETQREFRVGKLEEYIDGQKSILKKMEARYATGVNQYFAATRTDKTLTQAEEKEIALSEQFLSFKNNYHEILINSAIRQGAMSGSSVLRFATPYTVANIEGYIDTQDEDEGSYTKEEVDQMSEGDDIDTMGYTGILTDKGSYDYSVAYTDGREELHINSEDDIIQGEIDNLESNFNDLFDLDEVATEMRDILESRKDKYTDEQYTELNDYIEKATEIDELESIEDPITVHGSNLFERAKENIIDSRMEDFSVADFYDGIYGDGRYSDDKWTSYSKHGTTYYVDAAGESIYTETQSYKTSFGGGASEFTLDAISSDEHRAIAAKYGVDPETKKEGEFYKYLKKKRADLKEVEDDNGYTWYESMVTPEDKASVEMFQSEDQIGKNPIFNTGDKLKDAKLALEAAESRMDVTPFERKVPVMGQQVTLPVPLQKEAIALETEREMMDENPLNMLRDFSNKREGALPEAGGSKEKTYSYQVLRDPKTGEVVKDQDGKSVKIKKETKPSIFRRTGDEIVAREEFMRFADSDGTIDSEVVREKFVTFVEDEKNLTKREKEYKEKVKAFKKEQADSIAMQKIVSAEEKRVEKEIKDREKAMAIEARKNATRIAEMEGAAKIKEEALRRQDRIRTINAANTAPVKEISMWNRLVGQKLNPLKYTDKITQNIFSNWNKKILMGKVRASKEAREFGATDGIDTLLKYEKGENTKFTDKIKTKFDALRAEAKSRDVDLGYRENYLPHVYKEDSKVISEKIHQYLKDKGMAEEDIVGYENGNRLSNEVVKVLKLTPYFSRERVFPTYEVAMKYGLTPKYTYVEQLVGHYIQELEATVANNQLVKDLDDAGKILPFEDAPVPAWDFVNLPFNQKGYMAPPNVAKVINSLFGKEDASMWRAGAWLSKKMQEIKLSAGIPFTNINFFSLGQTLKEITLGNFKVLNAFFRANFNRASSDWMAKNRNYMLMMARQGIDMRTNLDSWESLHSDLATMDGIFGKGEEVFSRMFNKKTFMSFMPMMQIQVFKDSYNALLEKGYPADVAEELAGRVVSKNFGLTNFTARSQKVKDQLSAVAFAPQFREGIINTLVNTGAAGVDFVKNVGGLKGPLDPTLINNRKLIAGMTITYILYNLLNAALNDDRDDENGKEWMFNNPKNRQFALQIPTDDGTLVYVEFMPSFLSFARNMFSGTAAITTGDFSTAKQKYGSILSMPIQLFTQLWANQDYFGKKIYNPNESGAEQAKDIALYMGLSVSHPYITEIVNQIQDKKPLYQSLIIASELPLKFSTKDKVAQGEYYDALDKKTRENTKIRNKVQPIYDKVQKMKDSGDITGATDLYNTLSEDEKIVYNKIKQNPYERSVERNSFFEDAMKRMDTESRGQIEIDLTKQLYGEKYTNSQRTTVNKDFFYYREYTGYKYKKEADELKGLSNDNKILFLKSLQKKLPPAAYEEFISKGRKRVTLSSGDTSPILISDEVLRAVR